MLTDPHPTPRRRRAAAAALALGLALVAGPLAGGAGAQTGTTLEPPETICPAEEGNARYVRFIYLNILYRCPDEAGLEFWTGQLDDGLPRSKFADKVDLSTENLVLNNVVPLYGRVLEREPTASELAAGVAHIRKNQEDGRLIAALFASDEFYDAFQWQSRTDPRASDKDQVWLAHMYENILDRSPDEAGAAYFEAILGDQSTQATRLRVAQIMERSAENAMGWTFGVYYAGLNRPPDEAGFGFWLQWLQGPGQWRTFKMWTTVLSTPEADARAQTQPNPPDFKTGPSPEGKVDKSERTG